MIDRIELINVAINANMISKIEKLKDINKNREVVFLCVGNAKIWYDSFGPMVGTILQYMGINNYVYGNLKSNICQDNLKTYIDIIYRYHYDPYIVVVDNCLSASNKFEVIIKEGPTDCAGLSKEPISIGDCGILCLTPKCCFKSSLEYKNMLKCVKKLSLYFKEFFI